MFIVVMVTSCSHLCRFLHRKSCQVLMGRFGGGGVSIQSPPLPSVHVHTSSHSHLLSRSGSDGLVKLWTIKTNECVKTLDAHQDKVWGLHGNCRDNRMVTGSADSSITVWEVSVV